MDAPTRHRGARARARAPTTRDQLLGWLATRLMENFWTRQAEQGGRANVPDLLPARAGDRCRRSSCARWRIASVRKRGQTALMPELRPRAMATPPAGLPRQPNGPPPDGSEYFGASDLGAGRHQVAPSQEARRWPNPTTQAEAASTFTTFDAEGVASRMPCVMARDVGGGSGVETVGRHALHYVISR